MPAFLGNMILAGDIRGVINQWRKAGGGSAGWEAARQWLRARHPDSPGASIYALVARAQEVVQIGRVYRPAGPNFAIDKSRIPDFRRIILDRAGVGGMPPSFDGTPRFIHHIRIEVRDLSAGGRVISSFVEVVREKNILTKTEIEARARKAADDYLKTFVDYDPKRLGRRSLDATHLFEGIYRGY